MEAMSLGYFLRAGGFGMVQVALFALIVVGAAIGFAIRPDERRLPFLHAMASATLLSIGFAVVSDLATVLFRVPSDFEPHEWTRMLLIGAFESLTPAVLGLGLLSLAWLVKAIGVRRLYALTP